MSRMWNSCLILLRAAPCCYWCQSDWEERDSTLYTSPVFRLSQGLFEESPSNYSCFSGPVNAWHLWKKSWVATPTCHTSSSTYSPVFLETMCCVPTSHSHITTATLPQPHYHSHIIMLTDGWYSGMECLQRSTHANTMLCSWTVTCVGLCQVCCGL